MKMKLKKNDNVVVIAGKDKGRTGIVKQVMPQDNRVVVVGVNMVTRHTKPSQRNPQGGLVKKEMPIHASNVSLVDPKDNKATRAGYRVDAKGNKVRFAKRSGEQID